MENLNMTKTKHSL